MILLKITELYLAFVDVMDKPVQMKNHLLNQLELRNRYDLFENYLKEEDKILDSEEIRDEDYYLQKSILSKKKWIASLPDYFTNKSIKCFNDLDNEKYYAIKGLVLTIITQLSIYYHFKKQYNFEFDFSFHEKFYKYFILDNNLDLSLYKDDDIFNIWVNFMRLYNESINVSDIVSLKKLIKENKNKFDKTIFDHFEIEIYNYCRRNFRYGDISFKKILVEYLNEELEKESFLKNGIIEHWDYSSFVTIVLKLGDFDFARNFIFKYKDNLKPQDKENIFNYAYGIYFCKLKNYDESLKCFSKIKNINNVYYSSSIYNYMLQIYFEKHEFESTINLIDSYKHFLKNSKLFNKNEKIRSKNYLKYYEKIIKIKIGKSKISKDKLYEQVIKTENIICKDWLIESINELNNYFSP